MLNRCLSSVFFLLSFVFVSQPGLAETQDKTGITTSILIPETDAAIKERLRKLGWPPPPLRFPPLDDMIHHRGKEVVAGHLKSLTAFATIELPELLPASEEDESIRTKAAEHPRVARIPREEISFILLNGKPFPGNPPELPIDEDSVLLDDGQVLTGTVNISGKIVNVGARSVRDDNVALIHLLDPEAEQEPILAKVTEPKASEGSIGAVGDKPSSLPEGSIENDGDKPSSAKDKGKESSKQDLPVAYWYGKISRKGRLNNEYVGNVAPPMYLSRYCSWYWSGQWLWRLGSGFVVNVVDGGLN